MVIVLSYVVLQFFFPVSLLLVLRLSPVVSVCISFSRLLGRSVSPFFIVFPFSCVFLLVWVFLLSVSLFRYPSLGLSVSLLLLSFPSSSYYSVSVSQLLSLFLSVLLSVSLSGYLKSILLVFVLLCSSILYLFLSGVF